MKNKFSLFINITNNPILSSFSSFSNFRLLKSKKSLNKTFSTFSPFLIIKNESLFLSNIKKINFLKPSKTLLKFLFTLKPHLIKYFFTSKTFFDNFANPNKRVNIFKLSSFDWINDYLAKLTRDSIKLNSNDYLKFEQIKTCTNRYKKLNFLNNFSTIDGLYENNFFFTLYANDNEFYSNLNSFNKFLLKNSTITFFNSLNPISLNSKSRTLLPNFFISLTSDTISYKNIKNFSNSFNKFNKFEILFLFYFKPIFFKYLLILSSNIKTSLIDSLTNFNSYSNEFFFYSINKSKLNNNIIPTSTFSHIVKKRMLKIFNYSKFPTITSSWQYSALIRFMEFCSGKKTYLRFHSFLNNSLNFLEKAQCLVWAQKVKYFRKVLGPRLFLNESLQIIYLALKLKDPYILSNWIVSTMGKISFWKFKTFLRYIKYVLRYFFWVIFKQLNIKGIKFQLKGKISVAGNARTRTVLHTVGFTSHTTFDNKILYKLNLVKTFTGVLGLKLWIVF